MILKVCVLKGMTKRKTKLCAETNLWASERLVARNPRHAKQMLVHLNDSTQCQQCRWNKQHPTTGKVPTELHHIDGDRDNNTIGNVQLLCPNCHSLTKNFGKLNDKVWSKTPEAKEHYRQEKLKLQQECDHMWHPEEWLPEQHRT